MKTAITIPFPEDSALYDIFGLSTYLTSEFARYFPEEGNVFVFAVSEDAIEVTVNEHLRFVDKRDDGDWFEFVLIEEPDLTPAESNYASLLAGQLARASGLPYRTYYLAIIASLRAEKREAAERTIPEPFRTYLDPIVVRNVEREPGSVVGKQILDLVKAGKALYDCADDPELLASILRTVVRYSEIWWFG